MSREKGRKRNGVVILILLLLLIMGVGLTLLGNWERQPRLVAVPDVRTRVLCQEGELRHFGARIVLELAPSAPRLSSSYLYEQIYNAFSNLTFEEVQSLEGTEIARQAVRDALSNSLSEEEILGIYFPFILHYLPIPRR